MASPIPPPVMDPFGLDPDLAKPSLTEAIGPDPADPDMPYIGKRGDIVIPATYGGKAFVENNLMTLEQVDALITKLADAGQARDHKVRAEAAEKLLPILEAQAKLVPSLQGQLASLRQSETVLREALVKAQNGQAAKAEQAVTDDGTPIDGAMIYPVDPFYVTPDWFRNEAEPVLQSGDGILALIGTAGGGKTKGLQEYCARNSLPLIELSPKGSDPNDWIEYREVENVEGASVTTWKAGPLLKAIQVAAATGRKIVVFIDELDTCVSEFQMRIAKIFESEAKQRRMSTLGFGMVPCPANISWACAMNANGTSPASRHRGTITPALQNRLEWVRVPMFGATEVANILRRQYPSEPVDDIGECIVRLMTAADRGELDVDVSIRTGIKLCRRWALGQQVAWNLALLNGLDDPQMRSKAVAILADRFTLV